jgi:hypothetical protein
VGKTVARETNKTKSAGKALTAAKVAVKKTVSAAVSSVKNTPKAVNATAKKAVASVKKVVSKAVKSVSSKTVKKSAAAKTPVKKSKKPLKKNVVLPGDDRELDQEALKFVLTPQRDKLASHEKARLPERYHDNRVVLMVRDPWWMFAYWDFSDDHLAKIASEVPENQRLGVSRTLRVYRNSANDFFDIPVNDFARSWYINANVPECAYFVEMGLKTQGGAFFAIARSNTINAPYYGISDQVDEEWLSLDDATYARVLGLSTGAGEGNAHTPGHAGFGSDTFQSELRKRLEGIVSSHGVSSASLQIGLSSGQVGLSSAQLGMSSAQFQMGMSSAQFAGSSETMQKFGPEVFNEYTSAGFSSAQFMGSSENLSSGAVAGGKGRKRKFWLEVYTDVVVYGRTEPDAAVTFCNKPIKLNPDGTFRFYFTMPIGDYDFPVTAVSSDEIDTITIEPMVTRRTRHNKPYRIETEGFEKKSV